MERKECLLAAGIDRAILPIPRQRCISLDVLPSYSGCPSPLLEQLTDRVYTRQRSRLVDRWLQYRDLEFPTERQGGGACS